MLDIPAYGPDALPSLSGKSNPAIQDNGEIPPAYNLLREYADKNPDDPYISVAGVWNAGKNRYDYQAIPLYFPEDMIEEANGKVAYYGYRLKVKDNGIHRILAGFIGLKVGFKTLHFQCSTLVFRKIYSGLYISSYG